MKALFLILFGALILGLSFYQFNSPKEEISIERIPDAEGLFQSFQKDLQSLKQSQNLPENWDSIKQFKYIATTPTTAKWISDFKSPTPINSDGTLELEIVVIEWNESDQNQEPLENPESQPKQADSTQNQMAQELTPHEEQKGAIFQMSLIDIESQNKVWELSRTYFLHDKGLR